MVNVSDNVDLDVLGLFTSRTDKACLGGVLLNSKCFTGETEELVRVFIINLLGNSLEIVLL